MCESSGKEAGIPRSPCPRELLMLLARIWAEREWHTMGELLVWFSFDNYSGLTLSNNSNPAANPGQPTALATLAREPDE